jgi:hypothetical protein
MALSVEQSRPLPNAAGARFRAAIIAATVVPFAVAIALAAQPPFGSRGLNSVLVILGWLSTAHVVSTAYILFNPADHVGVKSPRLTLLAIPLLLVGATLTVLLALPTSAAMAFMLVYIHYGMWHFGRQNIGVLTFVSRISLGRSVNPFERATIMLQVAAGMFAAYAVFAPGLMLNPKVYPFDLSLLDPVLGLGWHVGLAINIVLVPTVAWRLIRDWRDYDAPTTVVYLAAAFFYLPIFVTRNPLIALAAWTIAHGLQYLVILAFHAASRPRPLVSFAALAATVAGGYGIWWLSGQVQGGDDVLAVKIAVAVITALTLVHYWVDQFLWKFNTPERRAWLAEHYAFLFQPSG